MRVVDVRDFCIPSDENDYDELVAFADTMASIPQFDAVPIEVLDEIRTEVEQLRLHKAQFLTNDNKVCIDSQEVLDIIDKYRGGTNDRY